jgi:hypothetical protein
MRVVAALESGKVAGSVVVTSCLRAARLYYLASKPIIAGH